MQNNIGAIDDNPLANENEAPTANIDENVCTVVDVGNHSEIKKRPTVHYSHYNIFFSDYLKEQGKVSKDSFGQMSKNASDLWKRLPETEKECFAKRAKEKPVILKELQNLANHMECFHCSKCGKEIYTRVYLIHHEKEYGQEFLCALCQKTYSSSSTLRHHVKSVHEKLKPCKCPICARSFASQGDLYRHALTHDKSHGFVCNVCQTKFSYKSNMQRHVNKLHSTSQ